MRFEHQGDTETLNYVKLQPISACLKSMFTKMTICHHLHPYPHVALILHDLLIETQI